MHTLKTTLKTAAAAIALLALASSVATAADQPKPTLAEALQRMKDADASYPSTAETKDLLTALPKK